MGTFKAIASKSSTWSAISLLGLLLACYANSFHGAWQYDDFINIVNNGKIHMTEFSWPQIRQALSAGPDFQILGRPLAYLSFALNYLWGADNPLGYHIVNVSIHFLTGFILFLFVRDTLTLPIFQSRYAAHATLIAWLSTLLWACHPIQVTAVTYVVQRMTAMAGLFYITAMYAYLIGRRTQRAKIRHWAFGLCIVSSLCAMLTKENSVLLPYAILLYELFFLRPMDRKTLFKALFAAFGVTVLLLLLSFLYTNPLKLFEPYPNRPFTLVERLLTQPRVMFIYLGLLAVPMASRMSLLHDLTVSKSLMSPWTTGIAILWLLAIFLFLLLLARRHRLFAFCGLFFLLNHAVEGSFLNLELIYEHRNYVPSMLLFIPLAVGIVRAKTFFYYKRAMGVMIAGCVGLILITRMQMTYEYNRFFASEYAMWRHVLFVYPNSSLAYNNLGKIYWTAGDFEQSYQHVLTAVELDKFNNTHQKGLGYYNLGLYMVNVKKDFTAALSLFESARKYTNFPEIWYHTTRIYMQMGDFDRAAALLVESLKLWPDDRFLNGLKGIHMVKKRAYAEAIAFSTNALGAGRIEERIALIVISQSHWMLNNTEAALQSWLRLLDKEPKNTAALLGLAEVYTALEQPELARGCLKRVLDSKGFDYLKNRVAFVNESENIMPYIPNVELMNELMKDMVLMGPKG
jgi:tetratricopeptide (TPR) repeat protein